MTITNPVFSVSRDGITAPSYEDILDYFQSKARAIFGSDINLSEDTQDGQLIAIFAAALNDVNAQAIAAFNSYNPATATGYALDEAVKTNGLARHVATHSTVDLKLVGQAGTVITSGYAVDALSNKWLLPDTVSIPLAGTVTVTATAEQAGEISAPAGAISKIGTPTRGWQTVTNPLPAVPGAAVETDAQLRKRQSVSTMQPGAALWDSLTGAIEQLDGVQSAAGRHNDTGEADSYGIPAHSIAVVVEGGDAEDIAEAIYKKKSQGVATFGAVERQITDSLGNIYTIKFSRPTPVKVTAAITVRASETWLSTEQDDIKSRLIGYIDTLAIGEAVNAGKCVAAIIKHDDGEYDPDFSLEGVTFNGSAASVAIDWNQKAAIDAADITITVK